MSLKYEHLLEIKQILEVFWKHGHAVDDFALDAHVRALEYELDMAIRLCEPFIRKESQ